VINLKSEFWSVQYMSVVLKHAVDVYIYFYSM